MATLAPRSSALSRGHWLRDHAGHLACATWLISFLVPAVLLLLGRLREIPYHEYVLAGARWLAHEPLYDLSNIDGFQYFPTAAWLFVPLSWSGSPFGDLLWRAIGWSAFATGLRRLSRRLYPDSADPAFLFASALAIGPAIPNLFNGQANLPLAALTLHSAVALMDESWASASALLALGIALKPLAIVPAALWAALHAPLRLPVALATAAALLAPFLLREPGYVFAQYHDCLIKLQMCGDPDRLFEDVRSMFSVAGVSLTSTQYLALRAGAACVALALTLRAKRLEEPPRTFVVGALAVTYLMLFNPRTLTSSYVMPAGFAALLTVACVNAAQKRLAWLLGAVLVAWTVNRSYLPWIEHWLKPLAGVFFLFVLLRAWRETYARASPRACP